MLQPLFEHLRSWQWWRIVCSTFKKDLTDLDVVSYVTCFYWDFTFFVSLQSNSEEGDKVCMLFRSNKNILKRVIHVPDWTLWRTNLHYKYSCKCFSYVYQQPDALYQDSVESNKFSCIITLFSSIRLAISSVQFPCQSWRKASHWMMHLCFC